MKKKIVMLIFSMLFLGCGGGEKNAETEKTPPANAPPSASQNASNANPPVNNASQMPKSAERVEQSMEANFKDGLPKGWEVVDPERENPSVFEFDGAIFRLKIPPGKDFYGENLTAPRLLKSVAGDFELETRVKFAPVEDYQGAGLLIYRNDNNYLRLERAFGGVGGEAGGIRFDRREDETFEPIATPDKFPTAAREADLKLRRAGREFTAFWRETGKTEWIEVGRVTNSYPEIVRVGLIGVNTADEIAAEFVYIRILPAAK